LLHFPLLVGLGVVVVELAVGLGTLIGIAPLTMAVGGSITSLLLWLSATWHVHPYFLGSDSIYAVAWAALALAIWEFRPSLRPAPVTAASNPDGAGVDRRTFLRTGVLAGAMLAFGSVAKVLARGSFRSDTLAQTSPSSTPSVGPSATKVQGKQIAKLDDLSIGKPVGFNTVGGEPSVLFKLSDTEVAAYSRVCTHAGCIVDYDASSNLLYCPCHGAEFDPTHDAKVVTGPAVTPLPRIEVAVDGTGRVVLPSSA
jgi:thiosulfate dehydrogenase [quinone] large subunit